MQQDEAYKKERDERRRVRRDQRKRLEEAEMKEDVQNVVPHDAFKRVQKVMSEIEILLLATTT